MSRRVRYLPEIISHEELRRRISYDPHTGQTVWLEGNGRGVKAGDPVGCWAGDYMITKLGGLRIYLHRLIWYWMTGEDPDHEIDHRDTDKTNNRWDNLRLATPSQNIVNRRHRPDVGLRFFKSRGWQASMMKNGVTHNFGCFWDKEEARKARLEGELSLFGEYAGARA